MMRCAESLSRKVALGRLCCRAVPEKKKASWRAFRHHLVDKEASGKPINLASFQEDAEGELWAHAVGSPEAGGLLLASNYCPHLLCDERLWQMVIFIVSHTQEGSVGLVLNRPAGLTFGKAVQSYMLPMDTPREVAEAFAAEQFYVGGISSHHEITVLHGHANMPMSRCDEVSGSGIYATETQRLLHAVQLGHDSSTFRFFVGKMEWGPGVLEREIQGGAWIPAACSPRVVLKPCWQLPVPLWQELMLLLEVNSSAILDSSNELEF